MNTTSRSEKWISLPLLEIIYIHCMDTCWSECHGLDKDRPSHCLLCSQPKTNSIYLALRTGRKGLKESLVLVLFSVSFFRITEPSNAFWSGRLEAWQLLSYQSRSGASGSVTMLHLLPRNFVILLLRTATFSAKQERHPLGSF